MKKTQKNEVVLNGALIDKTYHDVDAVAAIKDASLKKNMQAYIKAEESGQKAAWAMVRLIGKMATQIKKDFGSDTEFAAFMGTTQSAINKRKRLAQYADELEKQGYTVTNAFELLPLLTKVTKEEGIAVIGQIEGATATQSVLRETVKQSSIGKGKKLDIKNANNVKAQLDAEKAAAREESKKAKDNSKKQIEEEKREEKNAPKNIKDLIEYIVPWLDDNCLVDREILLTEDAAKVVGGELIRILATLNQDPDDGHYFFVPKAIPRKKESH